MKNPDNLHEHLGSFLETSSVLAHDISGQNHVAQFCVEELSAHVQGDAQKYISRLKASLEEICELTGLYRQIVRSQNPVHFPDSLKVARSNVEQLINLHYFKDKDLLQFEWSDESGPLETPLALTGYDLQSLVYGAYVLFIDAMKLSFLPTSPVRITLADSGKNLELEMSVEGDQQQLEQLEILVAQEGPFVGKTVRRMSSMQCLKKALKGEQEAVKIGFINQNQRIGIHFILKKK